MVVGGGWGKSLQRSKKQNITPIMKNIAFDFQLNYRSFRKENFIKKIHNLFDCQYVGTFVYFVQSAHG